MNYEDTITRHEVICQNNAEKLDYWNKLLHGFIWLPKTKREDGGNIHAAGAFGYYLAICTLDFDAANMEFKYFQLSNGSGYIAPDTAEKIRIQIPTNQFDKEVSADAAGIIASAFAFYHLGEQNDEKLLFHRFRQLKEYGEGFHPEKSSIFWALQ